MKAPASKFCQFVLAPPSLSRYRIAIDFNDPHYTCCGAVARFKLDPAYEEWLCAEHYELVLSSRKVAYEAK